MPLHHSSNGGGIIKTVIHCLKQWPSAKTRISHCLSDARTSFDPMVIIFYDHSWTKDRYPTKTNKYPQYNNEELTPSWTRHINYSTQQVIDRSTVKNTTRIVLNESMPYRAFHLITVEVVGSSEDDTSSWTRLCSVNTQNSKLITSVILYHYGKFQPNSPCDEDRLWLSYTSPWE